MTYPTLPLEAAFDNATDYNAKAVVNQFTEGGYSDKAGDGQNPIKEIRSVSLPVVSYAKKVEVDTFLRNRSNKPFLFDCFADATADNIAFKCREWRFVQASDDVWTLEASFEQVYRLDY